MDNILWSEENGYDSDNLESVTTGNVYLSQLAPCSIPRHYPAAVTRYNLITLPLSLQSINNVIHWL